MQLLSIVTTEGQKRGVQCGGDSGKTQALFHRNVRDQLGGGMIKEQHEKDGRFQQGQSITHISRPL